MLNFFLDIYMELVTLYEKKTLSTMLANSKNVLFPGHNHLLTPATDDPPL